MTRFFYKIFDYPWRETTRTEYVGHVERMANDPIFAEEQNLRLATVVEREAPPKVQPPPQTPGEFFIL